MIRHASACSAMRYISLSLPAPVHGTVKSPRSACLLPATGTAWFAATREQAFRAITLPAPAPFRSLRVRSHAHISECLRATLPHSASPDSGSVSLAVPSGRHVILLRTVHLGEFACLSGGPAPRRLRNPRGHVLHPGQSPLRDRRSFPSTGKADHCDPRSSSGARSAGSEARRQVEGT